MTTDHELLSGIIAEYGQAMFNLGALPDEADDYREILARKIDIMRKEMYDRLQSLLGGSGGISERQLSYALNYYSVDNAMNTPDFELATKLFWRAKQMDLHTLKPTGEL